MDAKKNGRIKTEIDDKKLELVRHLKKRRDVLQNMIRMITWIIMH